MDIRFQLAKPRKKPYRYLTKKPRQETIRLSPTQRKGMAYEQEAIEFLNAQGLQLLEQNLSCPLGELDLVMKEGDTLVFVEVRLRQKAHYGGAIASITPYKQQKLKKTALYFLPYLSSKYFHHQKPFCRFDACCFQENPRERVWLKNIFD